MELEPDQGVTLALVPRSNDRFWVSAQPIDATQALNLSAGVWNAKVLRGPPVELAGW
jgi:hypothetical protein